MTLKLYSLIGYLILPIMLLRLLIKSLKNKGYRQNIGQRLGFVKKINQATIWVHCVSVGEFLAATSLIDKIIGDYPQYKILITTTTVTGSQALKKYYQDKVINYYFPFDLPIIIKHYIKQIKPKICILLETEIWPNLIHILHKNKIPTLLINARLSINSFNKNIKFAPKLSKQTLNKLTAIATQDKNYYKRFIKIGVNTNKITITGNMKFDQEQKPDKIISDELKLIINKNKVVVFASTHRGEEEQIINSYKKYKIDALLIIIPRHPERFKEVFKLIKKNNISTTKRSYNKPCQQEKILLGDSMQEMMSYFRVADVVFIGGSLNNTGGHNMLEAAALAKAIIIGPSVFNFSQICNNLLKVKGIIQIKDADELFIVINTLLKDKLKRKNLGIKAQQYFLANQGSTKKVYELVKANITP